ncbi:helix-turn-helix domain-containing protein [Nocardiopsis sp. RV163]|uniref:helix-turn-helix domain-containing protein n=1 Tax=Nocardiopsis sp. RV163 TaxID=1661388 RepID=UPI00069E7DB6|nr:helix-turn-helix domain-containing protein [Nocardiopsis sp. RV163]
MATIGQTLSAARVAAGYTVADLSIRTRIREPVLRAIEQEDFFSCGGDFYARGHIRGICRTLGLDPAPLLAEYDREHASRAVPAFVAPQRHPASVPEAARVAAAARAETRPGEDGEAVMAHRFGEDDSGVGAQRWGHFERRQFLTRQPDEEPRERRGPRRSRLAGWIPGPRETSEGRRPRARAPEDGVPEGGAPEDGGADVGTARTGPVRGGHADGRYRSSGSRARGPQWGGARGGRHGRGGPVTRPVVIAARPRPLDAVRRHWPWAVVGAIFLLALFVGVRTWQDWDAGNPLRSAFDSSVTERTVDSAMGAEEAAAERGPVEFTVELGASGRSWVEVTGAEGEDLYVGYLLEGDVKEYVTEDMLNLWVGDAGAVSVTVDGEGSGPLGLPGEVKEIAIGPDGVRQ